MLLQYKVLILFICLASCYASPVKEDEKSEPDAQTIHTLKGFLSSNLVHGVPRTIKKHPYQVAILANGVLQGSGIIIDKRHIVTTAIVVVNLNPADITVVAGVTDYLKGEKLNVEHVKIHRKFKYSTLNYNIAVLKLQHKLEFNESITKISIGTKELPSGKHVTLSGWGITSLSRQNDVPTYYEGILKTISRRICENSFDGYITKEQICLLSNEISPCVNDYGDVAVANGKAYGLFSLTKSCDLHEVTIYTNLVALRSWIKYTIRQQVDVNDYVRSEHRLSKRNVEPHDGLHSSYIIKPRNKDRVQKEVKLAIEKEELEEANASEEERRQEAEENKEEAEALEKFHVIDIDEENDDDISEEDNDSEEENNDSDVDLDDDEDENIEEENDSEFNEDLDLEQEIESQEDKSEQDDEDLETSNEGDGNNNEEEGEEKTSNEDNNNNNFEEEGNAETSNEENDTNFEEEGSEENGNRSIEENESVQQEQINNYE